jgi:hypothetical protein
VTEHHKRPALQPASRSAFLNRLFIDASNAAAVRRLVSND